MNVPEHLGSMVTTAEAATHCGMSRSGVNNWVHRGYLKRAGVGWRNGRAVPVYCLGDVLRVARNAGARDPYRRRTR
ncbi:helix-turn-helix domain-containing protein [Jatrophihabitans sp. DSM 45814]